MSTEIKICSDASGCFVGGLSATDTLYSQKNIIADGKVCIGDSKLVLNGTTVSSCAAELNLLDGCSSACGIDCVGDITQVVAGTCLTGGGTAGCVTINHSDTSSQSSVNNSDGTVIQDVTLDGYGHVTALGSANLDSRYYTETEVDILLGGKLSISGCAADSAALQGNAASAFVKTSGDNTISGSLAVDDITLNGSTISDSGDFTVDVGGDITIDAGGGNIYIKDDGTTIGQFFNSSSDFVIKSEVNNKDLVFKGKDNGADITALTLDMSDAGTAVFNNKVCIPASKLVLNGTAVTSTATELNLLDGFASIPGACCTGTTTASNSQTFTNKGGNISQWTNDSGFTTCTGDVTGLTAGLLIDIDNGNTATPTVNVDLSELTDMTATMTTSDEFVVLDSSAQRRKAACEISNAIFSNGAGYTTCTGDITAVVAGTGMTGGATSGSATVNVIGGDGITANANDIEVDSTVVRTTGSQTICGNKSFSNDVTVAGDLTVTGDITCKDTIVSITSALSVTNTGTGPALTVTQDGTQPIAKFIDKNGDDIIFADDGKLCIAQCKLVINGTTVTRTGAQINAATSCTGTTTASNSQTFTNKGGNISQWTNNSGYTTCTGDITAVVAGTNLNGGATSGSATINLDGNVTGLTCLAVDTITVNGDTISTSGNAFIDAVGDITLDADGGEVILSDGGTNYGHLKGSTSDFIIQSLVSDKDIIFKGLDGAAIVSALTLDMSDGGTATFNHNVNLPDGGQLNIGANADLYLTHDDNNGYFYNNKGDLFIDQSACDKDIVFKGTDGGSDITALTLDMSDGGSATFNNFVSICNSSLKLGGTAVTSTAAELNLLDGFSSIPGACCTGTTTASNSQTFTNKGGNISQWTNNSGYTTCTGTGNITCVTTSAGLDGSGSSGTVTVSLDLSELTDKTDSIDTCADEIIMLDNGAERRKAFCEIFGSNAYNSTTIPSNNNQLTNGAGYTTCTGTTTASNSQTFTNKGGNISQWTNDSGYTTCTGDITGVTAGTLLDGGGSSGSVTLNVDLSELSTSTTNGDGDFFVVVDASNNQRKLTKGCISISEFNNNAGYTTCTGDITNVVAGTMLDGGGNCGSVTLNVDLGEAPDMTESWATGSDEFIVLDSGVQKRKLSCEIFGSNAFNSTTIPSNNNQLSNGCGYTTCTGTTTASNSQTFTNKGGNISQWTNNSGYTTCTGDITAVVAGTGMTGGATSGSATVNVIGGDGITANADDIEVDSTVVRTSNAQTIAGVKTFSSRADFDNADGLRTCQIRTYNGQQLVLNAGESSSYFTGQTNELVYLNAESGIQINSSPDNWSSGWAGRKTTTINDANGDSSFSRNITLGGTVDGRDVASDGSKLDGIACGATSCTGTVTCVVLGVGTGLDGGGTITTSGSFNNITLDLSELTDMTGSICTSQDELILLDNGAERRKLFCEIFGSNAYNSTTIPTNNNQLTNGSGYTTCTGTTTPSNTQTFTNKSGNISQWTNNSGYTTCTGTTTNSNCQTFTNKSGCISQWTNDSGYTTCTGDITGVTAGTLLDGGGSSGSVTLNVDLSELTDMTAGWSNTADEFVVLDNGSQRRKLSCEIFGSNAFNSTTIPTNNNQLSNGCGYTTCTGTTTNSNTQTFTNKSGCISQWTNDSGYTTCTGDITNVSVGTGLDGGGASGSVTISLDLTEVTMGTGLDSTATGLSLDLSEFTDMTGSICTSQDEIILLDNGAERRKLFCEIFGSNAYNSTTIPTNNNQLTNGSGYTTCTGTTTPSNSQTFTNKGGNISQWTNDSGYTTCTGTTTSSNSQTFTNKGGNISQWTNNSGYTTCTGNVVTSGSTFTGSITLNDGVCAKFGSSADFSIYHYCDNTYLDNDKNHICIRNNVDGDDGGNIYIMPHDNENGILIHDDGAVCLYSDNAVKLCTQSYGAKTQGTHCASYDMKAPIGCFCTMGIGGCSRSSSYGLCVGNCGGCCGGGSAYFAGNVQVCGTFSKCSGCFDIVHPLPALSATKRLSHSFVESPQADNIYSGVVQLTDGKATVNIDEIHNMTSGTLTALNRCFRTFTTNETNWDPVRGSVSGNTLTVESCVSDSTATVSWMVLGERHDPHMYENPLTDSEGRARVEYDV